MRFSGQIPFDRNALFAPDRFAHGPAQDGTPDDLEGKGTDHPVHGTVNIRKGPKGKYYWLHETNLYRNPAFLLLMWKIFFFIWLGIASYVMVLSASDDGLIEAFQNMALPMFLVLIFFIVLVTFSYWVYALVMGGKYTVLFEMDEKGVTHTQLPRQFKRAQGIAALAVLAGLGSKNPGAMGAGLLAAGRQSMRTDFKKLRSVRASRKRCTIKLRSGDLMHNQVYTAPEDFDFVLNFIRERSGRSRFQSPDASQ